MSEATDGLCVMCFGGGYSGTHCCDCGAVGGVITIPEWAAKAIREHDDWRIQDQMHQSKELRALRARLPVPPDVTAKPSDRPGEWLVQLNGVQTSVHARSEEEARAEAARRLSWIQRDRSGEKREGLGGDLLHRELRAAPPEVRGWLLDLALQEGMEALVRALTVRAQPLEGRGGQ